MSAGSALTLEAISRSFGGVAALTDVNLSVPIGSRTAIIGPNGAGKTTLFNIVSGALTPTSGSVCLFQHDVTKLTMPRRAALGLARTYQINNLFPALPLRENLFLAVQALSRAKFSLLRPASSYRSVWQRVDGLLHSWGLETRGHLPVKDLSYGEQRQVEILMAIGSNPRLLLLDEPTAGLSPGETEQVTSLLTNLPAEVTVLFVEHDMDVAFEVATHMMVLNHGEVVAEGTPDAMRRHPKVQEVYLGAE